MTATPTKARVRAGGFRGSEPGTVWSFGSRPFCDITVLAEGKRLPVTASDLPVAPQGASAACPHPTAALRRTVTTRRHLCALALLLPAVAMAPSSPAAPVELLNRAVLAIMRAGRTAGFEQRMRMLAPAVQAAFDLPFILARAVGPRFAAFPPEVQDALVGVFTEFTVATYVANFDEDNGERFDILAQTRRAGSDEVVQTVLVPAAGEPFKLDYVVRAQNGGWKIIDVLLNGSISRVAVQRSDFRSLLSGGDAAPLIASLRGKVSRLAAGQKD